MRDRTGLSLHHLGGTKANVYAGGQAAALDIPGLVEAMQKLAALPPEVSLDPTVTGLPEPIVILTGREAEEFRPASDPNPVPGLPEFPDFGLGLHGTVSPDGRRIAFTFGISDGTGLWMMDVDSGRYRHLHFFTGTRSLHWLTPDRLIFEWDHGVGCAAFDSDPPRIRSLNLPGEKHLFVLGVESPWITYRTVRGEKTVVQKVRIDGPGGCYLRPEPAAAGGEP